MRKSLIFFQLVILSSNLISQIEAYKMRHEISSHQFKIQALGEISQRATIIDSSFKTCPYQDRLIDALEQNAELYSTRLSFSLIDYYYRGQSLANTAIYYNHVALSSNLFQGYTSIFNLLDFGNTEKLEILYGQNTATNQSNSSATISLFSKNNSGFSDSPSHHGYGKLNYGSFSQSLSFGLESNLKHNWNNNFSVLLRQNNKYGLSREEILYPSEKIYNFQNIIQKRFSKFSKLSFYFSTSISSLNQKLSYPDTFLFVSKNNRRISPLFFSYLQWSKSSDESKWYTQLISTISYINSSLSDSFVANDNVKIYSNNQTYTTNKLTLQSNGFKNLGSRAVYYFGAELSAENIHADYTFSLMNATSYFLPTPILHSSFYLKKEFKISSDLSWFIGANIGVDQFNLQAQKPQLNTTEFLNNTFPNASIQAIWARHLCENSNYTINLSANYNSPKLYHIIPFFKRLFFVENLNLKPEKKINMEGNLYRKFDDKLELNFSAYYSLIQDAILTRDYFGENINQVSVYGKSKDVMQNQNANLVSNFGIDNEIKFHFSNSILAYNTFHIQKQTIYNEDKKYNYLQTPIYGNLGLKVKYKKLFSQIWLNYNLVSNSASSNLRYNNEYSSYSKFSTVNISSSFQLRKNMILQAIAENIFNAKSYTYFSQIANAGINGNVKINMEF